MKNNKASILLIVTGAFLFNSIFWNELLALNTILFDAFIIGSLCFLYRDGIKNTRVRYLLLAHIICLGAVILLNSLLSKIAFSVTLLLLVAFTEYANRSAWFAGGSLLVGFFQFIGGFFKLLKKEKKEKNGSKKIGSYIRFAIFPLLIVICFFIIYCFANTVFASIAANIGEMVSKFFNSFFSLFSLDRIIFLLFGFYLVGAMLLRARHTYFEKKEAGAFDSMPRIRKKRMDINKSLLYDMTVGIMGKLARGAMALKNEYKTGIASLALLNLLLLVVNLIDINYFWIHFTYTPAVDLSTMTHEGTDLLIFSIVLAMMVLLIFFRGNLNFYKKNKWLKAGAYLWLFQNAILVCSVLLRDYYYMREFALTYKRIGVLFFLLMVLAGLITVFIKVHYAKTTYYLLRMNAWCAIVLLVAASTIQWDVLIAKYNIAHRETAPLNLRYLLTISDKALPVLHENLSILKAREKELNNKDTTIRGCSDCIESIISEKRKSYLDEQQHYSWLSWNLTDANEKKYFNKPAAIAIKQ